MKKIEENKLKILENIENENNAEIIEIFSKLSEKEKEFYITDMKARILKKELE